MRSLVNNGSDSTIYNLDETFGGISEMNEPNDPDSLLLDTESAGQIQDIISQIATTRHKLGYKPLSHDAKLVIEHELLKGKILHHGHKRRNGDPYFDTHIIGTVKALIKYFNLTGLRSILTAIKHDDVEDVPALKEKYAQGTLRPTDMVDIELYSSQLTEYGDKHIKTIQQDVSHGVLGLTKIRKPTKAETRKKTFLALLKTMRDVNIRVGYAKLADRIHNMKTLKGHGQERIDLQMGIARETLEVYVPLARCLNTRDAEEILYALCIPVLNQKLQKDFERVQGEHFDKYRDPYKDKIIDKFKQSRLYGPGCIKNIKVQPHTIQSKMDSTVDRLNLKEASINDLSIDDRDPMFDFYIEVKDIKDVVCVVGSITSNFIPGHNLSIDIHSLGNQRGTLVSVFNKEYGGRLFFRINDTRSEARSRRGLLAEVEDQTNPAVQASLAAVIRAVEKDREDVYIAAEKELLKKKHVFYTRGNDPIELPEGATALDFARAIHSDLLLGAQKAWISDNMMGQNRRPFNLFDTLPPGAMVEIDSCLGKDKKIKDTSKIQSGPAWLPFCQNGTRDSLIRFLRKLPDTDTEQMGKEYIRVLEGIFYIDEETVLETIIKMKEGEVSETEEASEEERAEKYAKICSTIGRGEINLIEILAERIFFSQTSWEISYHPDDALPLSSKRVMIKSIVRLPDNENAIKEFLKEMLRRYCNGEHLLALRALDPGDMRGE